MPHRIKVLVADDSAFMRRALATILESERDIHVVATARNGEEAVTKTLALRPDVVTMDVQMPGVDGLEAVRRIAAQAQIPIIMVSAHTRAGAEITFRALEVGAVDFVAKPDAAYENISSVAQDLLEKVRGCAGRAHIVIAGAAPARVRAKQVARARTTAYECVAIGASTGGPVALTQVISALPASFSATVLIVQHMPVGFTEALARRLDGLAQIDVCEGSDGAFLEPGVATIVPAGKQVALDRHRGRVALRLVDDDDSLHVPSVDVLVSQVAKTYGKTAIGVILTGMGHDGAAGLRELKAHGGYVVGQDESTCVVYGMPRAAALAGVVDRVAPLSEISEILCGLCAT